MGFKDILTDNSKVHTVKVDGREVPFRKLTVEQMNMLEKKFDNINDVVKQKMHWRLQNADPTVTMADIDRLTEDQYLTLLKAMDAEIFKSNEDFQKQPAKKD